MSAGPISREREAFKVAAISTPDASRVCMINPDTNSSYCGRKKNKGLVQNWSHAHCADCEAAARADGRL